MKTMKWLLRREFWEHKGSMFWAPLVLAAVMFATMSATIIYALLTRGLTITLDGHHMQGAVGLHALPLEMRSKLVGVITSAYMANAVPLFVLMAFVVFWYCLGALYEERRDRSILFWKSLPASDRMTVMSKVVAAACVTPLITIAVGTALSLAVLLLTCTAVAFAGLNLFGAILSSPNLYLSPLVLVSLLPVYIVWAVPTIGWLLLVSSWARSKVFLWAVGTPLIALVVAKWINYLASGFMSGDFSLVQPVRDLIARILGGVIPGIWFVFRDIHPSLLHTAGEDGIDLAAVVTRSWGTLGTLDAWFGVALGAAMIYGAMRIRRFRDEG